MNKIKPEVLQDIENSFIEQYTRFYTFAEGKVFVSMRQKLLNDAYPVEFFIYLTQTHRLASYASILVELPDELYSKTDELIYNGLAWFKVVYGREINPYVYKRVRNKAVERWINIHKEWDKYCKKKKLKLII